MNHLNPAIVRAIVALALLTTLGSCTPSANAGAGTSTAPAQVASATAPTVQEVITAFNLQTVQDAVQVPDFSLPLLVDGKEGKAVSMADYRGSWVLLNFWATWCPPCRAEMPSMSSLQTRFGSRGITFLTISSGEETSLVADFITSQNHQLPVLLDTDGQVGAIFGIESIPTTFLVDPQGMIQGGIIGSQNWDSPEMAAMAQRLKDSVPSAK